MNQVDRRLLAFLAALVVAFGAAWAWQAGKLDGLAQAASARLREATIGGLMEGPYGTMTREMAERVYEIMRKRPEERAPEEVAFAYDALRWTGQLDRAEEFVAPWARDQVRLIERRFEDRPDKSYLLRAAVELGTPPGNGNPDRAVAVVACDYWSLPSQKTREERGITAVGRLWKDDRMEYRLVKQGGTWWIEDPLGKGHGGFLVQEIQSWPPLQPWPPK